MVLPASGDPERHGSQRDALDLQVAHHAQGGPAQLAHHVSDGNLRNISNIISHIISNININSYIINSNLSNNNITYQADRYMCVKL